MLLEWILFLVLIYAFYKIVIYRLEISTHYLSTGAVVVTGERHMYQYFILN